MKKILLLVLPWMLLAKTATAQFGQGTKHWGTTISFEGSAQRHKPDNVGESKLNNHVISPSVQFGKFTKDNLMLGLRLNAYLNFYKTKSEVVTEYESSNNYLNVTLSPFIRKYKTLSPKWALFLEPGLNLGYLRSWSKSINDDDESQNGFLAGAYIYPGIVYRVTPRFALEADLNLLSLNLQYASMNKSDSFGFNAGITSSIQQYFGIRASWYIAKSN